MDPAANGKRSLRSRVRLQARRLGGHAVLWLHSEAVRHDLAPSQFGDDVPLDPSEADAVVREWRRQFRLWAAYSPEQVLALKVGAAALGAVLAGWIVLARVIG